MIVWEDRLQNGLQYVEQDVKPYSIYLHSHSCQANAASQLCLLSYCWWLLVPIFVLTVLSVEQHC